MESKLCARVLRWFVCVLLFRSIAELVATSGWPHFRALELQTFREAISSQSKRTVIVCGGGIVETPEAARVLTVSVQRRGSQFCHCSRADHATWLNTVVVSHTSLCSNEP